MSLFLQVGHAGTLDPLATGLLVVCVGKATKFADRLDKIFAFLVFFTWKSGEPAIHELRFTVAIMSTIIRVLLSRLT